MVKGQDILVLLKLLLEEDDGWTYESAARDLGLSTSAVHRAVERTAESGLYRPSRRAPDRERLADFLIHAAQYIFPARLGGEARGIPTAWGALPLSEHLSSSAESIPVWPYVKGNVRGSSLEPIHSAVPRAALSDPRLGELLALLDAIRIGSARERGLAVRLLGERIHKVPAG